MTVALETGIRDLEEVSLINKVDFRIKQSYGTKEVSEFLLNSLCKELNQGSKYMDEKVEKLAKALQRDSFYY